MRMFTESYLRSTYGDGILIVYDGDCPLCKTYVTLTRLKEHERVTLIDARDIAPDALSRIMQEYNLNDGMLLIMGNAISYGHDAIHTIALLTTNSNLFNKLCRLIFSNKPLAKCLYPTMARGRKILLSLLGRKRIAQ